MKIKIISFLISLTSLSVFSQEVGPVELSAIDSIAKKYIKEYAIVGLSIGIVKNKESNTLHYGHTGIKKEYPVSDSTMFHLASISKLFTATAIMQLIENGQLSIDEKVVDIIPEFKMRDERAKKITIRHLLTHTSGLMWDNTLKNSPNDTTSTQLFIQKLNKRKLNFYPGEKLSYKTYSNTAFDLLGIIIEQKSGKKFDEYVSENILTPLQMKRSTYYFKDIDSSYLALPIVFSGSSKKVNRINLTGLDYNDLALVTNNELNRKTHNVYGEDYEHNPSGNLISSASELNIWMQSMMESYSNAQYNGILKKSSLSEMWTIQKNIPDKKTSIGLGWWVHQDDSLGRSVFHVGNNPGFCSMLMIFPEQSFGITILCNASYAQKAVWNKMTIEIAQLFVNK